MGAAADLKVTEIEATRQKLADDLRELGGPTPCTAPVREECGWARPGNHGSGRVHPPEAAIEQLERSRNSGGGDPHRAGGYVTR